MERLIEIRATPGSREIAGVAVSYSDVARLPWGQERFLPGSISWTDSTMLTLQHDRSKPLARVGAGLVLEDGENALTMRATMPRTSLGEDTLTLVRAGVLRGLSLEFVPSRTKNEGSVMVVEAAKMTGLSVVDVPAYSESLIQREARAFEGLLPKRRPKVWL